MDKVTALVYKPEKLAWFLWLFIFTSLTNPAYASQQNAQETASIFMKKNGWRYGAPSKTDYVSKDPLFGTLWRVSFSGKVQVDIRADTNEIVEVVNYSAVTRLSDNNATQIKIEQKKALEKAKKLINIVGWPKACRFYDAQLSPDTKQWSFRWVRTTRNIPYLTDMMLVSISSHTGECLVYGRTFISSPPNQTTVKIKQGAAIASARTYAGKVGIPAFALRNIWAKIYIVQPDDYWYETAVHKGMGFKAPSRVAWVVRFKEADEEKEFWIDASNGDLLGGTQTKGRSYIEVRLKQVK